MYGDRVHKAVSWRQEKGPARPYTWSKATTTRGRSYRQVKVPVEEGDTLESLRDRVQAAEREHYVDVLDRIARGEIVGRTPALVAPQLRHAADEAAQPFAVALQEGLVR